MGNGRDKQRAKAAPARVADEDQTVATSTPGPAVSNRAMARTLGGGTGAGLAGEMDEAARIDAIATRTMQALTALSEPAHAAIARTNTVMLDHAASYRGAYENFEQTLIQAGKDAAGPSAGAIIVGFASGILTAVGVGVAGGLIVEATTRLGKAVVDAVSEVGEMGAGTGVGAGVGLLFPPSQGDFTVPDNLDPRLKEIEAWKDTAHAWQALASLAQIGLTYSAVWRRAAEVHRDLHAYLTGGRGIENRPELAVALAKLRTVVLDSTRSTDIAALARLIGDFAGRAEHPLLHRASYFLEQDLWIEWISRLSGYNFGDESSDYWPVWMTDRIADSINEGAIEQRLAEMGLISIWQGTNYLGTARLMAQFHEGSEWSARALLDAAIAARRQMRDTGAVAIAVESGTWGIPVELPPPIFESIYAAATAPTLGPCQPEPLEPTFRGSHPPPWLAAEPEQTESLPRGRVLEVNFDMAEIQAGDLVLILGEFASGYTYAEKVTGSGGLPEWARSWVERLRAANGW